MSTPHIPQDDLFKQLDASLPQDAGSQKIKIGEREFSAADTAALQEAIEEMQTRYQRESDGHLQVIKSLQSRYVEPEQHQPIQQQPQFQQPQPVQNPNWAVEDWVKAVQADPVRATDQALARALGLAPGVSFADALKGLGAANVALTQKVQQMEMQRQADAEEAAALRFLDQHKDYEASSENEQVLNQYREANGLPFTPQGLHLAYLAALADGAEISKKPSKNTQTEESVNEPQPGVPNLRNSQMSSQDMNEFDTWKSRLDKIAEEKGWEEATKVIKNLYSQQGRR